MIFYIVVSCIKFNQIFDKKLVKYKQIRCSCRPAAGCAMSVSININTFNTSKVIYIFLLWRRLLERKGKDS